MELLARINKEMEHDDCAGDPTAWTTLPTETEYRNRDGRIVSKEHPNAFFGCQKKQKSSIPEK
jgi:hypothetical protein